MRSGGSRPYSPVPMLSSSSYTKEFSIAVTIGTGESAPNRGVPSFQGSSCTQSRCSGQHNLFLNYKIALF